jgi:hypothetical protein
MFTIPGGASECPEGPSLLCLKMKQKANKVVILVCHKLQLFTTCSSECLRSLTHNININKFRVNMHLNSWRRKRERRERKRAANIAARLKAKLYY